MTVKNIPKIKPLITTPFLHSVLIYAVIRQDDKVENFSINLPPIYYEFVKPWAYDLALFLCYEIYPLDNEDPVSEELQTKFKTLLEPFIVLSKQIEFNDVEKSTIGLINLIYHDLFDLSINKVPDELKDTFIDMLKILDNVQLALEVDHIKLR